jgi:hypothetical protein
MALFHSRSPEAWQTSIREEPLGSDATPKNRFFKKPFFRASWTPAGEICQTAQTAEGKVTSKETELAANIRMPYQFPATL